MAFCQAIEMFAPPNTIVYLEAPLNANEKKLPHGKVDIVIVTPEIQFTGPNIGVMVFDKDLSQIKLATSMKNETSIYALQSRKSAFLCTVYITSIGTCPIFRIIMYVTDIQAHFQVLSDEMYIPKCIPWKTYSFIIFLEFLKLQAYKVI